MASSSQPTSLNSQNIIRALIDPMTQEVMRDPVVLSCGHNLEQRTAEAYYGAMRNGACERENAVCPFCRRVVTGYNPSPFLRGIIERLPGMSPEEVVALPSHPPVVEERGDRTDSNTQGLLFSYGQIVNSCLLPQ